MASSHPGAHGPNSGHRVTGRDLEARAKKMSKSEQRRRVDWVKKGSQFAGHGQFPQ